jgi:hypothetical protein
MAWSSSSIRIRCELMKASFGPEIDGMGLAALRDCGQRDGGQRREGPAAAGVLCFLPAAAERRLR